MFKKIAVAATLAVLASSSFAADSGRVYAGADVGTSKLGDLAGRESSFGSFVGYQVTPMFGIEANVRRLGESTEKFETIRVSQFGLSLVATKPLTEGLNLFGRVGYNHLKATSSTNGTDTDNNFMYGVGLAFPVCPNVSARVELQKPRHDVNNLSAGVVFQF